MEQISEVEAFLGLNPLNPLCKPVDIEGPDVRRVVARRGIDPGMRPDVERPTPAFIVPSMLHVFFRRHLEEVETFCLRVAQVNCVHSDLHGSVSLILLSPRDTAGNADHTSLTFVCTLVVHLPNRPAEREASQ